jgi:hypothetical protein
MLACDPAINQSGEKTVARKVEVRLTDDLDNTSADETVTFGLDGINYEIDLSAKHAKELRNAVDKFIAGARRAGRPAVKQRSNRPHGGSGSQENQAIRAWAMEAGLAVADRGRIPQSIVEQYNGRGSAQPAATPRRAKAS